MDFSHLNTNYSFRDFASTFQNSAILNKALPTATVALIALCALKQSKTAKDNVLRPLVEASKIGAAVTQGAIDGAYHATTSFIMGIFSGALGASTALMLKVGTENSYLSPENLDFLESKIFASNSSALRMTKTYINPLVEKYFNTSCLGWFFDGLITAPFLHLISHPPTYAQENGSKRAAQVENAACYLGLVDPKKEEDPPLKQTQEAAALLTAFLVSGTFSILTGAIAYKTSHSPDFPKNVSQFLNTNLFSKES